MPFLAKVLIPVYSLSSFVQSLPSSSSVSRFCTSAWNHITNAFFGMRVSSICEYSVVFWGRRPQEVLICSRLSTIGENESGVVVSSPSSGGDQRNLLGVEFVAGVESEVVDALLCLFPLFVVDMEKCVVTGRPQSAPFDGTTFVTKS